MYVHVSERERKRECVCDRYDGPLKKRKKDEKKKAKKTKKKIRNLHNGIRFLLRHLISPDATAEIDRANWNKGRA